MDSSISPAAPAPAKAPALWFQCPNCRFRQSIEQRAEASGVCLSCELNRSVDEVWCFAGAHAAELRHVTSEMKCDPEYLKADLVFASCVDCPSKAWQAVTNAVICRDCDMSRPGNAVSAKKSLVTSSDLVGSIPRRVSDKGTCYYCVDAEDQTWNLPVDPDLRVAACLSRCNLPGETFHLVPESSMRPKNASLPATERYSCAACVESMGPVERDEDTMDIEEEPAPVEHAHTTETEDVDQDVDEEGDIAMEGTTGYTPKPVYQYERQDSETLQNAAILDFAERCPSYRTDLACVTAAYRGMDTPSSKELTPQPGGKHMLSKFGAVLRFKSGEVFGCFPKSPAAPSPIINLRWRIQTQWPHLEISINRKGAKPLICLVFGTCLEIPSEENPDVGQEMCSLAMRTGEKEPTADDVSAWKSLPADTANVPDKWQWVVTRVKIAARTWTASNAPKAAPALGASQFTPIGEAMDVDSGNTNVQHGPQRTKSRSRIEFVGLEKSRITAICDADHDTLTDEEKIVAHLAQGDVELSIFTLIQKHGLGEFTRLRSFFMPLMKVSRDVGLMWFYRLQCPEVRGSMSSQQYPLRELEVPRWLVEKWWVGRQHGRPNSRPILIPASWASFELPEGLPIEQRMFLWRLSVQREREAQQTILRVSSLSNVPAARAEFIPCPSEPSQYMVSVWLPESNADQLQPQIDTRVVFKVDFGDGKRWPKFSGSVVDDHLETKAHFNVFARGPELALEAGKRYPIIISALDDEVPTSRQLSALQLLFQNRPKGQCGVDIRALLDLGPRKGGQDALKQWFDEKPERRALVHEFIERSNMNEEQARAVRATMNYPTVTLWGPPGTGKTGTEIAAIEALAATGLRILFCATVNSPLDQAFDEFRTSTSMDARKFCRFSGGGTRKTAPSATDATPPSDASEQQDLLNSMWDNLLTAENLDLEAFSFPSMLEAMIARISTDSTHSLCDKALQYLKCLAQSKDPKVSKKAKKELRKTAKGLREVEFTEEFFKGKAGIQVVFTTTSRAAHEILTGNFRPEVIIVDECGQSTVPEVAIPLAAFRHSVKTVMFAGDHKQQRPVLQSQMNNEAIKLLGPSVFHVLQAKKDDEDVAAFMLVECFRMDEELMAFISDEFYNGSLICKAKRDIQLEGTIKLTMRSAGSRVWNRRRRIAIDVSTSLAGDRQISSHTYKNTPSLCNESEANALIATISKLLAVRPRPNQTDLRQVDPREILVGSPYSGQRRLLVEKLYQAFPNDVARQIRVMTVAAIQGSQGKVVLLSLTVNKLDNEFDIAFMAQENSLNVALSRGKHCLYIFGNFAPWIRGIHRKDKALVAKKVLSSLHHLVQDLDYKRDVIDVTDYLNILAGQEVTEPAIKDSTFVVNDAQRSNSNAAAAAAGLNNAPRGTGMGSYQTPAAPWRDGSGGGGGQGGKGGKGANKGKGTNKGKGKGKGGPGGGCGPGKGGKGPGGGPGGPGAGQSARVNPY